MAYKITSTPPSPRKRPQHGECRSHSSYTNSIHSLSMSQFTRVLRCLFEVNTTDIFSMQDTSSSSFIAPYFWKKSDLNKNRINPTTWTNVPDKARWLSIMAPSDTFGVAKMRTDDQFRRRGSRRGAMVVVYSSKRVQLLWSNKKNTHLGRRCVLGDTWAFSYLVPSSS